MLGLYESHGTMWHSNVTDFVTPDHLKRANDIAREVDMTEARFKCRFDAVTTDSHRFEESAGSVSNVIHAHTAGVPYFTLKCINPFMARYVKVRRLTQDVDVIVICIHRSRDNADRMEAILCRTFSELIVTRDRRLSRLGSMSSRQAQCVDRYDLAGASSS